MTEIIAFTENVVNKAKKHLDEVAQRSYPDLHATCPACGAPKLKQTMLHMNVSILDVILKSIST